jgi:hypothetical protein
MKEVPMSAHQETLAPRTSLAGLSLTQIIILAAYGLMLWLVAAFVIRYGTPAGLFGRLANIPVYAVTAAGALLLVRSSARWAGLRRGQLVAGTVIVSTAALFADGFAIAWAPTLYGADAAASLFGIAWLSFAVASSFAWALRLDHA